MVVEWENSNVLCFHVSVVGMVGVVFDCRVIIAGFLNTCCGEVFPVVMRRWGGLEMVMSEIMSLHLVVVRGWVHKSRVFVASSHMGMGSMGISKMSASGPLFLCRHSR